MRTLSRFGVVERGARCGHGGVWVERLARDHVRYRAVWEYLRTILGEVNADELVLVGIIFSAVVAYTWAPKLGESIGALFEQDED